MKSTVSARATSFVSIAIASTLAVIGLAGAPAATATTSPAPPLEEGTLVGSGDFEIYGIPVISGDRVFASARTSSVADGACPSGEYGDTETLSVPLDDLSAPWGHGWGPSAKIPGVLRSDESRGGVVVTGTPCMSWDTPPDTITTAEGQRAANVVSTAVDGSSIETAVPDGSGGWSYSLEQATDGSSLPWDKSGEIIGYDATTVWRRVRTYTSNAAVDSLEGTSLATGAVHTIPLNALCTYQWVQQVTMIDGRWALAECGVPDNRSWAIDLTGIYPPSQIPAGESLQHGYFASSDLIDATAGTLSVTVTETTGGQRSRTYGPMTTYWSFSSDGRWLLYFDADQHLRVVDLSWVARPTTVDFTAPTMTTRPTVPAQVKSTDGKWTFKLSYEATDNQGVISYDVRYRTTPPAKPTAAWSYPAALQGTTATSTQIASTVGTFCVGVRARDAAGNVSPWTPDACGSVAVAVPPTMTTVTPAISGRAQVGAILVTSMDYGKWTSGTTFTHQWFANGVAVTGATAPTFVPRAAQQGKKITVRVTGSKAGYPTTSRTSAATAAVGSANTQLSYQAHVQNIGWMPYVNGGTVAGTTGQGLRVEALRFQLNSPAWPGEVTASAHVQNIGWMSPRVSPALVGTTGQSLRVEAFTMKLTGEMADHYDIYYRTHAQNLGWLGWTKNGAQSGTAGYAYRLEAVQVTLIAKGDPAPAGSGLKPFYQR